jgi:DNA-binding FadR family transcriptional regulator
MRDHLSIPLDTATAREALLVLTEAQRLALSMEMINCAAEPASRLQLGRIETLARTVSDDIARHEFMQKETRKCG